MQNYTILWADDEIDLLKPHILFLNKKGYQVTPVNSGADALEKVTEENFDIIFLDENMPGMTGLETLAQIKNIRPNTPVVMITKSEEESIMEEAIGSKIADYLLKPINPNQIVLSIKKILEGKRLVSEKTNSGYQQDFRHLMMAFNDDLNHEEWVDIYKKLVYWELEIENTQNQEMEHVLETQKNEANTNFVRFIEDNYEDWLNDPDSDKPVLSHQILKKKVFPLIENPVPTFFFLIDNLRLDQWRILATILSDYYNIEVDETYYSILPTTTAYARNAIFSGMMPSDMLKHHPDLWVQEDDDEGKNLSEEEFLARQLKKNKLDIKFSYHKIITQHQGKQVLDSFENMMKNQLNVLVYNFVDMLSHARTDVTMIKEMMPDESAYRSLTKSWFLHSPLLDLLKRLSSRKVKVVITTDHGTICVRRPFKIVGDKTVNTNLRYKQGKNLSYDGDDVLICTKPERFFLPRLNVSTSYVFAVKDYFFAYPNNFNHYVNYYKDTFQHGGVSLEEVIVPFAVLSSKP